MAVYVVAMMTIHDPTTYRRYTDLTPPLLKRHGGKFLTRGTKVTTLEGEPFKQRMVILEFRSAADVDAWLADPDYVEAAKFRQAASVSRLILQEGMPNTEDPDPNL